MDSLVTIMTAQFAGNLAVAQSYLESNGIPAMLKNEFMNQAYTFLEVELQVKSSDKERAESLLRDGEFID